jgi:hypothetical protein
VKLVHIRLIINLITVYGKQLFYLNLKNLIQLFRPPALENHFNLTTYFMAWGGPWAPDQNLNTTALYNNIHVINRGQL